MTPEKTAFAIPNLFFGALLLAWPVVAGFSAFLLDDPVVPLAVDVLRHYVFFTALIYPAFFAVAFVKSRHALRRGSPPLHVLLPALLPIFSGFPWLLAFMVGAVAL